MNQLYEQDTHHRFFMVIDGFNNDVGLQTLNKLYQYISDSKITDYIVESHMNSCYFGDRLGCFTTIKIAFGEEADAVGFKLQFVEI